MKTVFIIHGTWGSPEENWFPWMKKKLEEKWYTVIIPRLPTPDNQSLDSWNQSFSEYMKYINKETIFVAHSVGPAFVLSILEQINVEIAGCYFAAGFLWNINISSFDVLNNSFVNRDFNWERIKSASKKFYMCHGSDDPYVPLSNAKRMSDNLWVEIDMIEWGWHLNSETWYTSFEYLLKKIK